MAFPVPQVMAATNMTAIPRGWLPHSPALPHASNRAALIANAIPSKAVIVIFSRYKTALASKAQTGMV